MIFNEKLLSLRETDTCHAISVPYLLAESCQEPGPPAYGQLDSPATALLGWPG